MPAVAVAPGVNAYKALECGGTLVVPDAPFRARRKSGRRSRASARWGTVTSTSRLSRCAERSQAQTAGRGRRASRCGRCCAGFPSRRWSGRRAPCPSIARTGGWATRACGLSKKESGVSRSKSATACCTRTRSHRGPRRRLILRIVCSLHRSCAPVWVTADPSPVLAPRYAAEGRPGACGAPRLVWPGLRHGLGLPVSLQTPYGSFMLRFRDDLKANTEFQLTTPKCQMEFPAGPAWMVFADIVPHAVESGQYAMEQTPVVPRHGLVAPERAPRSVLEAMHGRRLV